jgi:hypothetical protein
VLKDECNDGSVQQPFPLEIVMIDDWFGIHEGLAAAGRIPAITRVRERISAGEMALLIFCGMVSAAAVEFIDLGLRLPGDSIIFSMIPMALGLALAPRRLSGSIMGVGAFSTAAAFSYAGLAHYGTGAFISLCLTGPMMDLALNKARSGWRLYLGLVLAGISTNLLAFASRGASKLLGLDHFPGRRPFGGWWTQAIVTYPVFGVGAGLIAALCFFHLHKRQSKSERADSGTPL